MLHQRPMKLATWNINSVKARGDRLVAWLTQHRPDVLCLQELKGLEDTFPSVEVSALGYHIALNAQKTYNGVAILSLDPMSDIQLGLGDAELDEQARLISARIRGVTVMCAYFPNGGALDSDKYPYKLAWMARLRSVLDERFDAQRDALALCGDFNVALYDDDMARPEEWLNGVLANDEVRAALRHIAGFGLSDVVRPFHPDGGVYSWWDYRGRGFERGNGLRIDHVYCTPRLSASCVGAMVDRRERAIDEAKSGPSDHAPVVVEFDA